MEKAIRTCETIRAYETCYGMPKFIENRLLEVRKAKLKEMLKRINTPLERQRAELKAKLARI